jgi:hypothetical protein
MLKAKRKEKHKLGQNLMPGPQQPQGIIPELGIQTLRGRAPNPQLSIITRAYFSKEVSTRISFSQSMR